MVTPHLTHGIPTWPGRHVGLPKLVKFVSGDFHVKGYGAEDLCSFVAWHSNFPYQETLSQKSLISWKPMPILDVHSKDDSQNCKI